MVVAVGHECYIGREKPGRYVGAAEAEEDDEPFAEKLARLTATLEQVIRESLAGLGFGGG